MNTKAILAAILAAAVPYFAGCLGVTVTGCMGAKAGDTTAIVAHETAGETHVTYTVIPGDLLGDPAYAGKLIAIPTVPGKDIDFKSFYPDGHAQWQLTTKRTAVLDSLWAGANSADAMKFATDQWQAEHWSAFMLSLMDRFTSILGTYIPAPQTPTTQPAPTGQWQAQVKQMIADAIAAQLAKK